MKTLNPGLGIQINIKLWFVGLGWCFDQAVGNLDVMAVRCLDCFGYLSSDFLG